jgi:hypothetical protein
MRPTAANRIAGGEVRLTREQIECAFLASERNLPRTAAALGVSRTLLYYYVHETGAQIAKRGGCRRTSEADLRGALVSCAWSIEHAAAATERTYHQMWKLVESFPELAADWRRNRETHRRPSGRTLSQEMIGDGDVRSDGVCVAVRFSGAWYAWRIASLMRGEYSAGATTDDRNAFERHGLAAPVDCG